MNETELRLEIGLLKKRITDIENLLKDFPDLISITKGIENHLLAHIFNVQKPDNDGGK